MVLDKTLNIVIRIRFIILGLIILALNACSLVRIESEQKPLAVNDLNTRLLTQDYVGESMEVIQRASDSVVNANPTEETKKMLLVWKINTAKQLKKLAFQASP